MRTIKVGIIGGTGLYDPELMEDAKQTKVNTPFGEPSDAITIGKYAGVDVAVLPRHGAKHVFNPSNVNYRANIYALKDLGVTHILSPCAVGSLKEEIAPGEVVIPDQFIDRTHGRKSTFYDESKVCHISSADPFCQSLRDLLIKTANHLGIKTHPKGTCVVIEGPRFSTRAESVYYKGLGAGIINMTMVPECVLAREAQICYASIATVTDWDAWKEHTVDMDTVVNTMKQNIEKVKNILRNVIPKINEEDCTCKHSLEGAFV